MPKLNLFSFVIYLIVNIYTIDNGLDYSCLKVVVGEMFKLGNFQTTVCSDVQYIRKLYHDIRIYYT